MSFLHYYLLHNKIFPMLSHNFLLHKFNHEKLLHEEIKHNVYFERWPQLLLYKTWKQPIIHLPCLWIIKRYSDWQRNTCLAFTLTWQRWHLRRVWRGWAGAGCSGGQSSSSLEWHALDHSSDASDPHVVWMEGSKGSEGRASVDECWINNQWDFSCSTGSSKHCTGEKL